ncbi:MAG: helix-hairpin-helix domain-containing protein [Campylobacterales bacterium]|nr:helix-hairpin-helix domain-containing protein [Campylobacterales bacterium]
MLRTILSAFLLSASLLYGMSVSELNSASKEDLMKIKGIGESKAEAIIKYRKKKKFTSVDDVVSVRGIGEALAKNIKNDIKNGEATKKKSTKSDSKTKSTKEKKESKKKSTETK